MRPYLDLKPASIVATSVVHYKVNYFDITVIILNCQSILQHIHSSLALVKASKSWSQISSKSANTLTYETCSHSTHLHAPV